MLQLGGCVVCLEGQIRELEALQFNFQELPLLDVAAASEPTWELPLTEVNLNSTQHNSMTTAIQAPPTTSIPTPSLATPVKPAHHIAMAINQHLLGALEQLQWASPASSAPVS